VSLYLVPSTRYQVLGTKYVVPSRWYQIPRFVNSVHEPFTNRSRTSVHEQAFTNNSNTFTIAVHEQGAHSRSRTVHEQPFTNKPFTNIRTPFKLALVYIYISSMFVLWAWELLGASRSLVCLGAFKNTAKHCVSALWSHLGAQKRCAGALGVTLGAQKHCAGAFGATLGAQKHCAGALGATLSAQKHCAGALGATWALKNPAQVRSEPL
jgi:hypothetical protein